MPKYKQQPSTGTIDEATKIAKGIQKPNQTKEQTKLIAQGIQKGIAEYKKRQKAKAQELDKLKKKLTQQQQNTAAVEIPSIEEKKCKNQWLVWILLIITWLGILIYIFANK